MPGPAHASTLHTPGPYTRQGLVHNRVLHTPGPIHVRTLYTPGPCTHQGPVHASRMFVGASGRSPQPCLPTWLWGKLFHMLDTDSKAIPPSGNPCLSPPGCCHLIGAVTMSSKGRYIFLSDQLLQLVAVGNIVRSVHSVFMDPG